MTKRIIALMLALIMCLALFACGNDKDKNKTDVTEAETAGGNAEQDSKITPLLYKVTDKDGNVCWLFGSIHVGRDDFFPLPSYVLNAFNSSDALAVEFDIIAFETDLEGQVNMLKAMMCTDGRVTKDYLSEEAYNAALEVLADNGINGANLNVYSPAMWWSTIETFTYSKIGADSSLGIDRHLLNLAKENEKEILDVESPEFQFNMMAGFSEELQEMLLMSAVETYKNLDESKQDILELLDVWSEGNEQKFSEILNEAPEFESEEEAELYKEYTDAMIVTRNKSMTEYAENALKSGKEVFICVGAAHIVGDGAMAENLRSLGYTVEIVK